MNGRLRRILAGVLSGGGGAAWIPTELSDLRLWLDQTSLLYQDSEMTTPATSGEPVGAVTDLSGNNNHATQATDGKRMTARAGMIKSAAMKCLQGYGDFEMDLPDLFGSSCIAMTVVMVLGYRYPPWNGYLWVSSSGGLTSAADYIGISIVSGQYNVVINQAGGAAALTFLTGIIADANPHIISIRWDNAKIYFDVDELHYEGVANVGALNLSVRNTWGAGYSAGAYVLPCKAMYYSLLGVGRYITDAELVLIQGYYARTLGFPFNDYYKSVLTGLGVAPLHDLNWQPQIIRLASGRMFMVFTEYVGVMELGASTIRTAYSDDDGATWVAGNDIVGDGSTDTVNNGGLYLLSNGTIVCTYYKRAIGGGTDAMPFRKISADSGVSWGSEAAMNDLIGIGIGYIPYTNGVTLDDDTILQPCYSYGPLDTGPTNEIFVAKSVDGGVNWTKIPIATGSGKSFIPYNEMSFARNGDTIVAMVRHETTETYWHSRSTDRGETWSAMVNTGLGTSAIGFPASSYDGNMLIFVDRTVSPNFWISWDDGATWTLQYVLSDINGTATTSFHTAHILVIAGRHYMVYTAAGKIRCFVRSSGAWI